MTHTHLITPKDKDFLKQDRKDPITGDKITLGDEVVFCASCKSVFLKDSWEYLGGQHCGQSATLEKIPERTKVIEFKERILFYKPLIKKKKQFWRPHMKKSYWENNSDFVSPFAELFSKINPRVFWTLMSGLYIFSLFFLKGQFLSIMILFYGVGAGFMGGKWIHDLYYKKKILAKQFDREVFYISRSGVGMTDKYGFDRFLKAELIDDIVIKGDCGIFNNSSKIIVRYGNKHKATFKMDHEISPMELDGLVRNLQILSSRKKVPIELRFNNKHKRGIIKNILAQYPKSENQILLLNS